MTLTGFSLALYRVVMVALAFLLCLALLGALALVRGWL
jgi:hypothetical protein